jgi:hypothetical protein
VPARGSAESASRQRVRECLNGSDLAPKGLEPAPCSKRPIRFVESAKAAPDGYNIGYGNVVTFAINRLLLASLP